MRRIRLTHIGLDCDGKSFPEGAELIVGEDVSETVAASRVAAGTAEVLDDAGVTFAFVQAAEAWVQAAAQAAVALTALLDQVEAGGPAERRWFFDIKSEGALDGDDFGRRITDILAMLGQDEADAHAAIAPTPADEARATTDDQVAAPAKSGRRKSVA